MDLEFYYVYILETTSNTGETDFFISLTNDLIRSKKMHKEGEGAEILRGKKKIELKYFETFTDFEEARKRVEEMKTLMEKKIEKLICNFSNP